MYWSVVTLTSVGYGDVVPKTNVGRFVGGFIMLLGVGLVALPAAILGGRFADEIQVRRERLVRKAKEKLEDGELDKHELRELLVHGQNDGFSEDEIAAFTQSARELVEEMGDDSFRSSRQAMDSNHVCPRCGYVGSETKE